MNGNEEKNNEKDIKQKNISQSSITLKEFFYVKPSVIILYVGWIFICLILFIFYLSRYHNNSKWFILILTTPAMIIYIFKILKTMKQYFTKSKFINGENGQKAKKKFQINYKIVRRISYSILILAIAYGGYYLFNNYRAKRFFSEAMEYKKLNNLEKAVELLEDAINANNKMPNVNLELGEIYEKINERNKKISDSLGIYGFGKYYDKIYLCYEKEIENFSTSNHAYQKLEKYLENEDISREALVFFDKLISEGKSNLEIYYLKGIANKTLHKNDEAIECCYYALKYDNKNARIYELMGGIYYQNCSSWYQYKFTFIENEGEKSNNLAIEQFEKVISVANKMINPLSYFQLGTAYYYAGNKAKQVENYKKAAILGNVKAINWFNKYKISYK